MYKFFQPTTWVINAPSSLSRKHAGLQHGVLQSQQEVANFLLSTYICQFYKWWIPFQLFCYTRICWAIWENFNNKKLSSSAECGANGSGDGGCGGWRSWLARCRRLRRPTGKVRQTFPDSLLSRTELNVITNTYNFTKPSKLSIRPTYLPGYCLVHWTRIACKVGLNVRQIVLKNVIYL